MRNPGLAYIAIYVVFAIPIVIAALRADRKRKRVECCNCEYTISPGENPPEYGLCKACKREMGVKG